MKNKFSIIFPILILLLIVLAAVIGVRVRQSRTETVVASEKKPSFEENQLVGNDSEAAGEAAERMITEAELREMVEDEADVSEPVETPPSTPTPLPKYDGYLEVNPYVAGWLAIDGSKIDGPVVYTPGSQNYFLHRALDGSDSERGTYFIAINWRKQFNHTLIYGHNMKDGSGFGSMLKFADSSYGMKHNIIHFDTLYEDRDYELLGVFYSQIQEDELETEEDRAAADKLIEERSIAKLEEQEQGNQGTSSEAESGTDGETSPVTEPEIELTVRDLDLGGDWGDADIYREEKDEDNGRFRYYYYTDLEDRNDFDYYVSCVKERALYDTGVSAEWGDELLTLSTCSYQVKNGRFAVVAVHHRD